MAKTFGKEKTDPKTRIVFSPVSKEIGEGENKSVLKLTFNQWTGRFDLRLDDDLIISSVALSDCVKRAEERGATYTEQEKKVTFKVVE